MPVKILHQNFTKVKSIHSTLAKELQEEQQDHDKWHSPTKHGGYINRHNGKRFPLAFQRNVSTEPYVNLTR